MSDLIRRDDLLKKECCGRISGDDVRKAPAVDAVEVVRCFGCKHSDTKQTIEVSNNRLVREYPTVRYCERFNTEVNNSFFCGYGEWRTKNANDTGKSD